MNVSRLANIIDKAETFEHIGKIENVVGIGIEASGIKASIGDIYTITSRDGKKKILAEAVGFKDEKTVLMPYDFVEGIGAGDFVKSAKGRLKIPVGDNLCGRVVNSMGQPIDGKGDIYTKETRSVENNYVNPLERPTIKEKLDFGIKAIDGFLAVGKGQRIGIFSGSGVGKSTLLGMIAKKSSADINVIALVGERGREVKEFIERDLGEEGMRKTVLVVATSDQPAVQRAKCPLVATTIAEYFREEGKNVMLMMDSLTRFAMAQREIGLATGEPPVARGYTPSIYGELPKLLERSGNFKKGSITGIYTVLVEGDDTNEPISDTARGILDGHIILSRKLAAKNHFPAIEISGSISRLMNEIVDEKHRKLATKIRNIKAVYDENEDLISIGAYKPGGNFELDDAVKRIKSINNFLKQDTEQYYTHQDILMKMEDILKDEVSE